jgi:hypothetical protein
MIIIDIVTQNNLVRNILSASIEGKNPAITFGSKSPQMIRYEIPTPKHLTAIAKSIIIAAFGYVIFEQRKKLDFRPTFFATLERSSKPIPEKKAHRNTRNIPNPRPVAKMKHFTIYTCKRRGHRKDSGS